MPLRLVRYARSSRASSACPSAAITPSSSIRRVAAITVAARNPSLARSRSLRLAVVEHCVGAGKRAAARLGDQRRAHAQCRRPARVDRQHGLDEILVERRAAQDAAAAACDQRRLVGRGVAQRGDRRRRVPFRRQPAPHPAQQLGPVGLGKAVADDRETARIALRDGDGAEIARRCARCGRDARASGSQCHGASCAQPWLMTVRRRSIGQGKVKLRLAVGRSLSLSPTGGEGG